MSARDTALQVLIACRRDGAWADSALKQQLSRDRLDRREAALATRLCYGVVQNRMLLDAWLSGFVRGKTQPVVTDILRLALYQIRFLDKIPPSAAVNEAVDQARRFANPQAARLVNAVLRNALRSPERLGFPKSLPLRYSHPEQLVALLGENVGVELLPALLESHNRIPPVYVQTNRLKTDTQTLCAGLLAEGLAVSPHPVLADCLMVSGGGVEQTAAYREGLFYVQDPAAHMAVTAAALRPGMRVLDCCAAPGGKSFAAAMELQDQGELISCDFHEHKIALLEKGAARLGIGCMQAMQADATVPKPEWEGRFDAVLADVPCSGLGVIRKKPDIRYKPLTALEALPELQKRILQTQSAYVRPGGVLLYSTCTLLQRENALVVRDFLEQNKDFTAEAFTLPNGAAAPDGECTLLPCVHDTDGFFICKLRRNA